MKIKGTKNNIAIEGNLIFDNAEQVKESLLNRLEKITPDKEVVINLSQVHEIDSSGIQLLIALFKSLDSRKCQYKIDSISDEIAEILQLSGLNKFFKA